MDEKRGIVVKPARFSVHYAQSETVDQFRRFKHSKKRVTKEQNIYYARSRRRRLKNNHVKKKIT